ncbi:MAG: hypothetical protein E7384_04310 [Ruminococcaceae bacterium]|nr:hypothetical protein [Oscillospiraceae bacterium]
MKKIAAFLICIVLLFSLCSCDTTSRVINSLPDYESRELFYEQDSFRDYTDYARYRYKSVSEKDLLETDYFRKITADDTERILAHIENFEMWVEVVDWKENYDFDKSIVSTDDFFYLYTKAGQRFNQYSNYEEFDVYKLFYFDIDMQILYYFSKC